MNGHGAKHKILFFSVELAVVYPILMYRLVDARVSNGTSAGRFYIHTIDKQFKKKRKTIKIQRTVKITKRKGQTAKESCLSSSWKSRTSGFPFAHSRDSSETNREPVLSQENHNNRESPLFPGCFPFPFYFNQ